MDIRPLPTDSEAASSGIEPLREVRTTLIDRRNHALTLMPETTQVVLELTHAIWWLSVALESRDGAR